MHYGIADWHFHWYKNDLYITGLYYEGAFDEAYHRGWQPKVWYKPWTWKNYYVCYNKRMFV